MSRNFDFSNLRSGQFSDQTIIRQRNICKCFLFRTYEGNHPKYIKFVSCQATLDDPCIGLTPYLSFGSFEVLWGQMRFLPMTFDITRLEHWGWSQCASLTETHRQICNMTCLGHHVTSRDLYLRSNLGIKFFFRSTCIYFDASRQEEHDGARIISPAFLVQELFAINLFL